MSENYWILQGKTSDSETMNEIRNETLKYWTISAHANRITKQDKAIIWMTGDKKGCYAICEIVSEPEEIVSEENRNRGGNRSYRLAVKITHNLFDNPVLNEVVDKYQEFKNFNAGTQGTCFTLEVKEYNKILELAGISEEKSKEKKSNQSEQEWSDTMYALNTILYGPPGTGKTFNTILRAARIVEPKEIEDKDNNEENYTEEDYKKAQKIFNQYLGDRIEFITFHQNYSYEDFIQGLRPDIENGKNLTFVKKDGLFKRIATRALFEYYKVLKKEEELPDNLEYEKIKELLEKVDYEDLRNIENKNVPKYVIIIDEINRANISRVFGELITLIEDDKRSHGDIPLKTTLPSGDKFIVPSNLYIIGTMNTADKSIALVDIALRRRFEFVAMYPYYDILLDNNECEKLKKINENIIDKKGYDFQIGHSYFMGNESLKDKMNKKVIPLLLEYFMNTETEVRDILKKCGFELVKQNDQEKWPLEVKE